MSNETIDPKHGITNEQFEALKTSLSSTAREVATATIAGIVNEVENKTKSAVIAALQEQKLNVDVQSGRSDSKGFKVLLAIIPTAATLLALLLGFLVWIKQKDIETTISQQDRNLTTQLALTQEFYKRKFDIYDKTHQEMTSLLGALQVARLVTSAKTEVYDRLSDLDTTSKSSQLYMTADVAKGISEVWGSAIGWLSNEGKIEDVAAKISSVEQKMRAELTAANIGSLTPCAASSSTPTPKQ